MSSTRLELHASTVNLQLAAFEPFGGRRINRAAQALERVRTVGVTKTILPVDFAMLPRAIDALVSAAPDAILIMGEADRPTITIERIAVNMIDAQIPDNAGSMPRSTPVLPGHPQTIAATWDTAATVAALRRARIRIEPSDDAGRYACNAALFLALAAEPRCPVGFVHVPAARGPWGPRLSVLARAVEAALGPWSGRPVAA